MAKVQMVKKYCRKLQPLSRGYKHYRRLTVCDNKDPNVTHLGKNHSGQHQTAPLETDGRPLANPWPLKCSVTVPLPSLPISAFHSTASFFLTYVVFVSVYKVRLTIGNFAEDVDNVRLFKQQLVWFRRLVACNCLHLWTICAVTTINNIVLTLKLN